MDYYFCLITGDVLTNFTNIVELIPCTAAGSFDLYFHFHFAQARLTCTSIFISLSNIAPIFLTLSTGDIVMFPIFIDLVVTFSSDAEVPKIMNSVLLSLSFSMLVCIELRSASMQRSNGKGLQTHLFQV